MEYTHEPASLLLPAHSGLKHRTLSLLAAVCILLTALISYRDILKYQGFTGNDTLTLIEASRIETVSDVLRILTTRLMGGTAFPVINQCYRPVLSLSFSMDYALWKLDPFGYHLTNLVLHMLVSALLFFTVRSLCKGENLVAFLAAFIFASHPVALEVVPAPARRHDLLASFFQLLSIFFFITYHSENRRSRIRFVLSLLSYCLALHSKESAILMPCLIALYFFLFHEEAAHDLLTKLKKAFIAIFPFIIVTVVAMAWRYYVLGTIGKTAFTTQNRWGIPFYYSKNFFPIFYQAVPTGLMHKVIIALSVGTCCFVAFLVIKSLLRNGSNAFTKMIVFFLTWAILPLSIHFITKNFSIRHNYFPLAGFASALSCMLVAAWQRAKGWAIVEFVVILLLPISFLIYSPLFRSCDDWKRSSQLSKVFLEKFSSVVSLLPVGTEVQVDHLPMSIGVKGSCMVQSDTFLMRHSLQSWLDLNHPQKKINVQVESATSLAQTPTDFRLVLEEKSKNKARILIEPIFDVTSHHDVRDAGE